MTTKPNLVILVLLIVACIHKNVFVSSFHSKYHHFSNKYRSFIILNSESNEKKIKSGQGFGFGPKKVQSIEIKSSEQQTEKGNDDLKSELDTTVVTKDVDTAILSTKMFKRRANKQEEELERKIQELKEEEDLIATDPSVGAVPELVANRMIARIAGFFGIPVFGGMAIFVAAFFASKKYDLVVPPVIVAYATQFPFVLGLVGISYAILSSSWDDEDGSLLGIDEFKVNVQRIRDGFDRTKQTATLKEDIAKAKEKLRR